MKIVLKFVYLKMKYQHWKTKQTKNITVYCIIYLLNEVQNSRAQTC